MEASSSGGEVRYDLARDLLTLTRQRPPVESTQPGKPTMGLLEERRVIYEREARTFAAELLILSSR
jgi:hypothetical protein